MNDIIVKNLGHKYKAGEHKRHVTMRKVAGDRHEIQTMERIERNFGKIEKFDLESIIKKHYRDLKGIRQANKFQGRTELTKSQKEVEAEIIEDTKADLDRILHKVIPQVKKDAPKAIIETLNMEFEYKNRDGSNGTYTAAQILRDLKAVDKTPEKDHITSFRTTKPQKTAIVNQLALLLGLVERNDQRQIIDNGNAIILDSDGHPIKNPYSLDIIQQLGNINPITNTKKAEEILGKVVKRREDATGTWYLDIDFKALKQELDKQIDKGYGKQFEDLDEQIKRQLKILNLPIEESKETKDAEKAEVTTTSPEMTAAIDKANALKVGEEMPIPKGVNKEEFLEKIGADKFEVTAEGNIKRKAEAEVKANPVADTKVDTNGNGTEGKSSWLKTLGLGALGAGILGLIAKVAGFFDGDSKKTKAELAKVERQMQAIIGALQAMHQNNQEMAAKDKEMLLGHVRELLAQVNTMTGVSETQRQTIANLEQTIRNLLNAKGGSITMKSHATMKDSGASVNFPKGGSTASASPSNAENPSSSDDELANAVKASGERVKNEERLTEEARKRSEDLLRQSESIKVSGVPTPVAPSIPQPPTPPQGLTVGMGMIVPGIDPQTAQALITAGRIMERKATGHNRGPSTNTEVNNKGSGRVVLDGAGNADDKQVI